MSNSFVRLFNKCVIDDALSLNSCDRLRKIVNKSDVLIMNIN